MAPPPPPPPQWVLDLNSTPPSRPKTGAFPDPPGFTSQSSLQAGSKNKNKAPVPVTRKPPTAEEMDTLKLKKAWEAALAPAKQLPMNAIGMYMAGNSLQIFSIFMVLMLFKGPVQAMMGMQNTFARFEGESGSMKQQMLGVKAVFVACNLAVLALGVWKVDQMGLLPTTRSDWLAWETAREPLERAYYVP